MPVACDDRPSGETAMGIPIAYPAISRDACSAKADILKTHATVPALSAGALSLAALRLSTAQSIRALASRPGAASAARNRRDMSVIRFQTGCWKPEASQARKPLANAWTCATVTRSSPYSPILASRHESVESVRLLRTYGDHAARMDVSRRSGLRSRLSVEVQM